MSIHIRSTVEQSQRRRHLRIIWNYEILTSSVKIHAPFHSRKINLAHGELRLSRRSLCGGGRTVSHTRCIL